MSTTKRWMQSVKPKKGALSRQLGIPEDKNIPITLLRKIVSSDEGKTVKVGDKSVKVTNLLKKRSNLAITYKKTRKSK